MLNRRSFLRSSLAFGLGLFVPRFDRALASPFSPNRVAIFDDSAEPKARWIGRLAKVLGDHYAIPSTGWANRMAKREALASTSLGHGFGLLHQFQNNQHIRLATTPVDWWLFLFPNGIEWDAIDEQPVYGMIGQVFPTDAEAGFKLRAYALATQIGCEVMKMNGWWAIARLDRTAAAHEVNLAVNRCIGENS